MATKTKETKNEELKSAGGVEWKSATLGELPPLCIPLENGKPIIGIVVSAEEAGENRVFYRLKLIEPTEGMDKNKNPVSFNSGDIISVPGSGALDYQMKVVGAKLLGKLEEKAKPSKISEFIDDWDEDKDGDLYSALTGHMVKIERGSDDVMPSGKWKGKTVKRYTVQYN